MLLRLCLLPSVLLVLSSWVVFTFLTERSTPRPLAAAGKQQAPREVGGFEDASIRHYGSLPTEYPADTATAVDLPISSGGLPSVPLPMADSEGARGYALAILYSDQQTACLRNLLSLQCWAKQMGMRVVEPFIMGSEFGTPLPALAQLDGNVESLLRFSDIYDVDEWNSHYLVPHSFPPFASWEEFLSEAPRNVIIVKTPIEQAHCERVLSQPMSRLSLFFQYNGFTVATKRCLSLDKSISRTIDEVNELVMGSLQPKNATVMFDFWRGIVLESEKFQWKTVKVVRSECSRHALLPVSTRLTLSASKKVSKDADVYINIFLNDQPYIAVMVRFEYMIRSKVDIILQMQMVQNAWKFVLDERKLNATFIAWDIGRFGSVYFQRNKTALSQFHISESADSFFKTVYGNSTSIYEWERSFVVIGRRTNPGYIAMLQKTIAARAKCLIVVGGGSFQRHALAMYTALRRKSFEPACTRNLM